MATSRDLSLCCGITLMRFLLWLLPSLLTAQTYDVVLQCGRVMDPESGLDVRNVGINGKQIAAISTRPLKGKVEIDAAGLVVAPGFVDLHSHGQTRENQRYKAMDGPSAAFARTSIPTAARASIPLKIAGRLVSQMHPV